MKEEERIKKVAIFTSRIWELNKWLMENEIPEKPIIIAFKGKLGIELLDPDKLYIKRETKKEKFS